MKNNNKRILLISPFSRPDLGGVESHLYKLMIEIKRNRRKVTLITYTPLNSNIAVKMYEDDGDVEIIRVKWFGKGLFRKLEKYPPLNIIYLLPGLLLKSLDVYIKRNDEFDVIHAHGIIGGIIGFYLKKIKNIRLVISTHAIYGLKINSITSKLLKTLFTSCDKVLAVGEPSRDELIKIGVDSEKVEIHPNWVDQDQYRKYTKLEAREILSIPKDEFLILFIGRMIEIKGELILLEAAKILDNNYNIKFVFIGSGPTENKIIECQSKKIKIIRNASEEIKNLYLNAASLFCSPVIYDEGYATVYLESISSGLPVVTTNRGCIPYFLDQSVAYFMDEVNPKLLAEKISDIYNNYNLLNEKKNNCKKYADIKFSKDNAKIIINSYYK